MSTTTEKKVNYIALPTPVSDVSLHPEVRRIADDAIYPCRRCQSNALPGDILRLVSYNPFLADDSGSPYIGRGPIYVHGHECQVYSGFKLPKSHQKRPIALRAYDSHHMMVDAALVTGQEVDHKAAEMLFEGKGVEYVHAHHAAHGCFAFKIERVA